MLSNWDQSNFSATGGSRFDGGKIGAIFSASSSTTHRGNQDMEVTYTPTLDLQELNPCWYQVNRRRWGASGAVDIKAGNGASFVIRGLFNRFIDDHENRQRVRWAVGNSRIDRELRRAGKWSGGAQAPPKKKPLSPRDSAGERGRGEGGFRSSNPLYAE